MGIVIKQGIRNSIFSYLGFGLGAFNTMILMPAIMLKEQMGLIQSITSYTNIFAAFFTLGMPLSLVKFYNDSKAKGQESALLFYMLVIPMLAFGIFSIFYFIFREPFLLFVSKGDHQLIGQYFDLTILMTFSALIFEIFTALLKNYFITDTPFFLKELLLRILNTIALALCYFKIYDYHTLVYVYAGIFSSIGFILMFYSLRKTSLSLFNFGKLTGKKSIFTYGAYTLLNVGISYFIFQLDIVMIQKYIGLAPLAVYSIALNISVLVQLPQRALLPVMHGVIAKAFFDNDMVELESVYKKSSLVMIIAGGIAISLLILGLPPVLKLILPPDYIEGLFSVFIILCFAKYIDMFFGFNGYIILQSKYFRFEIWAGIMLLFICIGLNMLLIKPFGINGAAIASLLGFLVYNLVRFSYVLKKFNITPFNINTIKAVLITFIPLIVILLIPFPKERIEYNAIACVIYSILALTAIILVKPSDDIDLIIKKILAKFKK